MNSPKITAIVPVYNAEKYLEQALDSLVNQTLSDIEIICVDDGSIDRSWNILVEYKKRDNRIVLIRQQNQGAGTARNSGIENAHGEYIHFLDADDYLVKDAYEVLYRKAKENNIDFLKAKVYGFDDVTGEPVQNDWYTLSVLEPNDFDQVTSFEKMPYKCTRILVAPWNGIYRRTFLMNNNIRFNTLKCVNDRSFYNSVLIHAKRIMFVDYFMLYYRSGMPSSLVGIREKNFNCHFESYNIIKEQSGFLPHDLQRYILDAELRDMFTWYHKFQKNNENIRDITRNFIANLDISIFRSHFHKMRSYKDYLSLKYYTMVSIVLTIYNMESCLEKCIDSLLAQTMIHFELICVDDGSTDASLRILHEYAKKDKRLKIITQENMGPGTARNIGINHASGAFLVLLDSDDFFEPNFLEEMVSKAIADGSDVVVCRSRQYDTLSDSYHQTNWTVQSRYLPSANGFSSIDIADHIFQFCMGWAWDKLYRMEYVRENGFLFPDLRNSEDLVFTFSSLAKASRISFLDKVLINHRINRQASVSNSRSAKPTDFCVAINMLKQYLMKESLDEIFNRSFINWALHFSLWNLNTITGDAFFIIFDTLHNSFFDSLRIECYDEDFFYNPSEYRQYLDIRNNECNVYLYKCLEAAKEEAKKSREMNENLRKQINAMKMSNNYLCAEVAAIKRSVSFRIGRAITYIPRKVRTVICHLRSYGFRKTVVLIKQKILK